MTEADANLVQTKEDQAPTAQNATSVAQKVW
jgi:hypothetical protein